MLMGIVDLAVREGQGGPANAAPTWLVFTGR
jgi:hypothetical protein